ncbi:MAG: thioredoxin domain-containing protein [Acidobacteriota bacterium]|nr:thioredoxin domain-containing protein [Acidobacteriota bacterium]
MKLTAVMSLSFLAPAIIGAQQSQPATAQKSAQSEIQKSVEAYLRNLYAFGSDTQVTVGPPKETNIPGLLETKIDVKIGENVESVKFYVSKDGKYLVRGELSDMTKDSLAESRAKLQLKDAPSSGDPNGAITMVEFSDFECPVCRSLHDVLQGLLITYPQVHLVFKDFPLEQHPWARLAAISGRCAYTQDPKAFWKLYDLIYDNQEIISAENAYNKFNDYASQISLNAESFKSCLSSPEAAAAVDASRTNGLAVEVSSTPTVFINGRRIIGADPHLIEQNIKYELARPKTSDH